MRHFDLTGRSFGRLTAISPRRTNSGAFGWLCRCRCGNEKIVRTPDLINGHTQSCGCLCRDKTSTHHLSNTPPYDIWSTMLKRCKNPLNKDYPNYGGRGITVCAEWENYPVFYQWMLNQGYVKGLTIDRIDNEKGYSPDNCRLATMREQQQNRRNSIYVTYDGVNKPLIEFSRQFGIPYQTIYWRYKHHRDIVTGRLL